jgi:hypothetical protein
MTDIAMKAFGQLKRKKISYDILEYHLTMIDELAKITSCTRAQILDTLLFPGMRFEVEFMIKSWKKVVASEKGKNRVIQEKIRKLLKDTEDFKKKWEFKEFPASMKKELENWNP